MVYFKKLHGGRIMEQELTASGRSRKGTAIGLIFVFFFAILLCAPRSYDDFEFSDIAQGSLSQVLDFCLGYGNGRLLGNLTGVLLQRSVFLAAGVKALTLTALVALMPRLLGFSNIGALLAAFALLAGMEPGLFGQTITWTSGFGNFVPPAVLPLVALALLQDYDRRKTGGKVLSCLALAVVGVAGQLYAEHSTLVNLLLALVVLVKTLQDRKNILPGAVFFLACLAGGGLMVAIPKLFADGTSHTQGYRSVHLFSLRDAAFCCVRNFLRLCNQYCGLSGIPVCLGALFAVKRTAGQRQEKWNTLLYTLSAVAGGYMLLTRLMGSNNWGGEMALVQHLLETAVVVTVLGIWIFALFFETDRRHRDRQLLLLGLALFSLAPLLIVHPIGFRVQFHSFVFILLACLHGGAPVIAAWQPGTRQVANRVLRAGCLLLALAMGNMFFSIHTMDRARNNHIRQEMEAGAKEIFIFRFPYPYIHDSRDPGLGMYFYYNEPMDIDFPVLAFDIWQDQYWDSAK